jgi:hypothetical protein
MDTALAAVIVAVGTVVFNVVINLFGGSWKLSTRLSSMEVMLAALQDDIRRLGDVMVKLADMRGEVKVVNDRLGRAEVDIRELRHFRGFVNREANGEK